MRNAWPQEESGSGFQNVPINPPGDIETTFFVAKEEWRNRMKVRVKTTDGIELSTICRQLKMKAPDGKMCEVQLTQRRIDGR